MLLFYHPLQLWGISFLVAGAYANVSLLPRSVEAQSNPRGIPLAPFVDDVEKFVDSRADIEPNLKKFQEMIAFVSLVLFCGQVLIVGVVGQEVPVYGNEYTTESSGVEG